MTGGLSVQDAGGGANRALSNLANVAINAALAFAPGSDVDVDLITVGVTGTPKLWWDEATDSFEMNKSLTLPGGSLKIGDFVLQQDTVDNDGLKKTGSFHIYPDGGVAGNIVFHEGTEPTVSASGTGHRMWVDASHNLQWQNESGVSVGLASQGDITTHAAIASAHHARYADAEAIAAVKGQAILGLTGKVGIGTTTIPHGGVGMAKLALEGTNAHVNGPHVQFTTPSDDYPLFQMMMWRHDDIYLAFDAYYDGTWRSADAGSNFVIQKNGDAFKIRCSELNSVGTPITWNDVLAIDPSTFDITVGAKIKGLTAGSASGEAVEYDQLHEAFLQSDADSLYEAIGGIATHAAVSDAHHARFTAAEAIAAIQGEAMLEFQQPTIISTKSGAGVIELKPANALILDPSVDVRCKTDFWLYDNKKSYLGTSKDYWLEYNTSGSRLRWWTKDGDGEGTDMVWMRVLDGTIDPQFLGAIEVDAINEFTADAGVTIEGVLLKDGFVGIGVGVPGLPLEVRSADDNQAMFFDSTAQAAGVGGGIAFGGKYTDAGDEAMAGRIGAEKTNATSGNVAFDMIFETQDSVGIITERMKLTSAGDLLPAGTVDGRDVATDGTKLDGITSGAEPATKEFFVSAGEAILSSNASYPTPNDTYHLALADGVPFARCFFVFRLPSDFSSMASGYPKVVFKQGTGGTGNYRIAFDARAGGVGEQMGGALDNIAEYTMAAPGQGNEIWEEDVSAAFDGLSLAAGDSVGLQIQRDSDGSLDTFSGDLDVVGVVVKYA